MSDDPIAGEAAHLWRAVFGEPPVVMADGRLMLQLILSSLPPVAYGAPEPEPEQR